MVAYKTYIWKCIVTFSEDRLDSVASGADLTETISESAFSPPPDYADVMNGDFPGDDTDDNSTNPITLHLSTSPHSSDSSTNSRHSGCKLLVSSEHLDEK